jgi:hypothetical protein
MKAQNIPVNQLHFHESNPRFITDDKFKKLCQSIIDFPDMLNTRPIVAAYEERIIDDKPVQQLVVLGGNMRLKACLEIGLKDVPVIIVKDWTEEQKKEFIIKDNVGFGEWDFEMLANQFDNDQLVEWGLDVWQTPDEDDSPEENLGDRTTHKISLEFTDEQFPKVLEAFNKHEGTKENTIMKLLGL